MELICAEQEADKRRIPLSRIEDQILEEKAVPGSSRIIPSSERRRLAVTRNKKERKKETNKKNQNKKTER